MMAPTGQTGVVTARFLHCAFEHDRVIERQPANLIMRQQPDMRCIKDRMYGCNRLRESSSLKDCLCKTGASMYAISAAHCTAHVIGRRAKHPVQCPSVIAPYYPNTTLGHMFFQAFDVCQMFRLLRICTGYCICLHSNLHGRVRNKNRDIEQLSFNST